MITINLDTLKPNLYNKYFLIKIPVKLFNILSRIKLKKIPNLYYQRKTIILINLPKILYL